MMKLFGLLAMLLALSGCCTLRASLVPENDWFSSDYNISPIQYPTHNSSAWEDDTPIARFGVFTNKENIELISIPHSTFEIGKSYKATLRGHRVFRCGARDASDEDHFYTVEKIISENQIADDDCWYQIAEWIGHLTSLESWQEIYPGYIIELEYKGMNAYEAHKAGKSKIRFRVCFSKAPIKSLKINDFSFQD